MNNLEIIAGCVFCDVSPIAIAWMVLVMVLGFVGIVLSIFELLRFINDKRNQSSEPAPFISASHALMIGTLISYSYYLNYSDLTGYETLPAIVASIASVLIFIAMWLSKHTPKTHLFSLGLLVTLSSAIYFTQGNADWTLVAFWSMLIVLVSAMVYLIKSRK